MQLFIHSSCEHAVSRSVVFTAYNCNSFIYFSTICSVTYIYHCSHPSPHTSSLLRRLGLSTLHDASIHLISCRNYGGQKTSMDSYCPSLLHYPILDCNSHLDLQRCLSFPSGTDSTCLGTCYLCCASTERLSVQSPSPSPIPFSTSPGA
jgi:hypothetical protein